MAVLVAACGAFAAPAAAFDPACRNMPTSDCVFLAAEQAARAIPDRGERASAFKRLATTYARLGRIDQALAAGKAASEWSTMGALQDLAWAFAEGGHFEQAVQVARKVNLPDYRAWTLMVIAEEAAGAGRRELADSIVEEVRQIRELSDASLRNVAKRTNDIPARTVAVLARGGRFDEALELAAAIDDPFQRSNALAVLVDNLATAGLHDQAAQVAGRITDVAVRAVAIAVAAKALARGGHDDRANRLFDEARQLVDPSRVATLKKIAVTRAKAGHFEVAEELAGTIADPFARSLAIAEIGEQMSLAGQDRKASLLFEQATRLAARLGDPYIASVIEIAARAGHIDDAERLADTIKDSYIRAEVLGRISIAAAAKGQFEAAVRIFSAIPATESYARSKRIPKLVVRFAQGGVGSHQMTLVSQALDFAVMEPARNMQASRVEALAAIAEVLAKAAM